MQRKNRKGYWLALMPFIFTSFAWSNACHATANQTAADQTQITTNASTDPNTSLAPVDTWHFLIAPYLWGSSLTGNVTVAGKTTHTSIPFSKILSDLQFGGQVHIEASRGPWTLMLDPTYLKLSQGVTVGPFAANFRSEIALVDAGVFYRVYTLSAAKSPQTTTFEVLGGARYFALDNTFSIPPIGTFSSNTQTTSPIVGGRIQYSYNSKIHVWLRGDVGGFHVDDMNSTWSSTLGLSYTINKLIDVGIAYKVLKIDYSNPSMSMNTLLYGPMIGIGFHW